MFLWPGTGGIGDRAHVDPSPTTISGTAEELTMSNARLILCSFGLALAGLAIVPTSTRAQQLSPEAQERQKLTEADHQRLMDLLHMTTIRRGRDGNNKDSPFYANYDEAKANPFPKLPDPLVLKNG